MGEFFYGYFKAKRKTSLSTIKEMRLLELMNPELKSFFKRDPFEMMLLFVNGLHEDLNHALKRN